MPLLQRFLFMLQKKNKRKKVCVTKKTLLARDGDCCFYCGKFMNEDDRTKEHILAIANGGTNHIANLVLVHRDCGELAGHLSIAEKVILRDKLRKVNHDN